jgi:glycosyltransferase involved in cell wall biosynthesis
MNIVQVTPMDPYEQQNGGVMIFVERLIGGLMKNNHHVKLLGITKNNDKKKKINYRFIPVCNSKIKKLAAYKYDLKLLINGKKYIEEGDIIHVHRFEFLLPFLKIKNPKIITVHINFFKEVFFRKNWLSAKIYAMTENYILKNYKKFKIKKIVFVDNDTKRDYEKRFPDIKKITEQMPVGIDLEKFNVKPYDFSSYGIPKNDKIIISVGRLVKEKDLSLAINAFKYLNKDNTSLVIIGDGPDRKNLEKLKNNLGLKNCFFLGQVPNNRIPSMMNAADMFIITSIYEGTPTTVLEALASGIPVISTDAGGIKDIINGKNGIVINERNYKKISKYIDIYLKKSFKKECISSVKPYTMDKIVNRYTTIYKKVVK